MPRLGDLIGRLADDDHRVGMLERHHPHRAADQLWPDQGGKPAGHVVPPRRGVVPLRRHHGELAARVHEHDAHMAQMLELERQFLIELGEPVLRREVLHGGGDEALGDFERGFDLNPGGGAGIQDRDRAGQKRGEKIDHTYRDEELGADRPLIPKLLQHGFNRLRALPGASIAHFLQVQAGELAEIAVHVGRQEIARATLAIGLPNVPGRSCEAGWSNALPQVFRGLRLCDPTTAGGRVRPRLHPLALAAPGLTGPGEIRLTD